MVMEPLVVPMTPAETPDPIPDASNSLEAQRRLTAEILERLHRTSAPGEAVSAILAAIQAELDLEAVALRLGAEDDFPYVAHRGFPAAFIEAENCLRAHSHGGEPLFDEDGVPLFECVCGLVLTGKTDSANPLFSPEGSAWTNDARPVVEISAGGGTQVHTRNRCLESGYRSIAIVPLRAEGHVVGALQLNDRRPGRFNAELIQYLEGISTLMGRTLSRRAWS